MFSTDTSPTVSTKFRAVDGTVTVNSSRPADSPGPVEQHALRRDSSGKARKDAAKKPVPEGGGYLSSPPESSTVANSIGNRPVPLSPDALTAFSKGDPDARERNRCDTGSVLLQFDALDHYVDWVELMFKVLGWVGLDYITLGWVGFN